MTSSGRPEGIDEELRAIVERAFPEVTLEVVPDEDGEPPAFRSPDVRAAWQRMHDAARGREVLVLLEMLDGNWLREEERWKAVTFLGFTLHTEEGASRREPILRALALEAAVKQRGTVPRDAVRLQGGALEAIANAPVAPETKWQCMLDAIPASRSHFRELLNALSPYRPTDAAAVAEAVPVLLDAMMRSERLADLDSLAALVRQLDLRSTAPDVRRLLLAANSHLASRVASILADWEDREAAAEIRRAVEQYRHASDPNVDGLLDALYRLEGAACVDYVTEVFLAAPAALQEHLLQNSLRTMASAPLLRAIAGVVATTRDVDLKKAAEECLEHLAAHANATAAEAGEPVAVAPAGRDVPPAGGPSPPARTAEPGVSSSADPDATADASWKPTWDDASLSKPAAPAAAAPDSASTAPWRPSEEEPAAAPASAPVGDSDARARRLAVEAEALAAIRQEARRSADESASWQPAAPEPVQPGQAPAGPDRAGVVLMVLLGIAAVVSVLVALAA